MFLNEQFFAGLGWKNEILAGKYTDSETKT